MNTMYIGLAVGIILCYFAFSFFIRLLVNYHLPKIDNQLVEMNKTLRRIEKQNAKILASKQEAAPAEEQPKENA